MKTATQQDRIETRLRRRIARGGWSRDDLREIARLARRLEGLTGEPVARMFDRLCREVVDRACGDRR